LKWNSQRLTKTAGTIFDRSSDGDFRVTHAHQITEIHSRKNNHSDPNNFAPFPKNPALAKFFIQPGRVVELN
jgi:hypothetical protein